MCEKGWKGWWERSFCWRKWRVPYQSCLGVESCSQLPGVTWIWAKCCNEKTGVCHHDTKVSLHLPVCVQLNTSGVFHKRPYILKSNLIRLALLHQGRWADIAEHQPCIYSVKYWSLNASAGVRDREPFTLDLSCLLISHVSFNRNLGKPTAQTHNPRSIIPNPCAWLIQKDLYCILIINPYPSSMTSSFAWSTRVFV